MEVHIYIALVAFYLYVVTDKKQPKLQITVNLMFFVNLLKYEIVHFFILKVQVILHLLTKWYCGTCADLKQA